MSIGTIQLQELIDEDILCMLPLNRVSHIPKLIKKVLTSAK